MRMPPNCGRCRVGAQGRRGFNGGRHAHAAESGRRGSLWCRPTGFNGGRHAHAAEFRAGVRAVPSAGASMEGGMRMPPNSEPEFAQCHLQVLQWRAACACRRITAVTLQDGVITLLQWRAACACRRIWPMVPHENWRSRFNGGRHAHAAESPATLCSSGHLAGFNGGRHAHAAESHPRAYLRAPLTRLQWRAACACRRIRGIRR